MGASKTVQISVTERVPVLEHVAGPLEGNISEVRMDIVSMGRTDDNDVVLAGEGVSRCHAFLKKTPQGWLVQDNRSKNGVYVNGLKVNEAQVNNGDVIQVGDFAFRFVLPEDAPGATPAAPAPAAKKAPSRAVAKAKPAPKPKPVVVPTVVQTEPNYAQAQAIADANAAAQLKLEIPAVNRIRPSNYVAASEQQLRLQWILGGIAVGISVCIAGWLVVHRRAAAVRASTSTQTQTQTQTTLPSASPAPSSPPAITYAPPVAPEGNVIIVAPNPPPPPVLLKSPPTPSVVREDLEVRSSKRKTPRDEKRELAAYLKEGKDYLKEGDFESAAIAFRFALVLDPRNSTAIEGLRAVEYRGRSLSEKRAEVSPPPPTVSRKPASKQPSDDRRRLVIDLMRVAKTAFGKRSYQEAIEAAEKVRGIEIRGETNYLNEAKQIIDRSRTRQKEDFEPFVLQARQKIDSGDYAGGLALCEEMLRSDPAYKEAKQCQALARELIDGRRK